MGHFARFRRTGDGPQAGMPHVLIIIQNLPLRLDRRVRHECLALLDAGAAVSVICPKADPDEPDRQVLDGVRVHSYRAYESTGGVASYMWEFASCFLQAARLSWRVHRSRPFDVLQACNPPDTYWLLGALWKRRGRAFVYDQHDLCPEVYEARFGPGGLLHRALLWHERATYRVADHVISPNPAYREIAMERGHLDESGTTVVMSTPDHELMRRGPADPQLRHSREHLVCYVGIMGPQDGVDNLLAAIDAYVHRLGRQDAHFALLGFGDDADRLRADCTARGLDPWVTFTGRVDHDEIGRWLSTADVGVTPDPPNDFNHRSTMNKTLEYMAHEVPVVAVDLRETRRCAQDAATYVSGLDPMEMAKSIAMLLDDPERRQMMGRRGRQRIKGPLSWKTQAAAYTNALTTAAHRAHP